MKKIALTGIRGEGKFALVDNEDFKDLSQFNWTVDYYGYVVRCKHIGKKKDGRLINKTIRIHRVIVNPSIGLEVDHANGDRLDNRKMNLRVCSSRQNQMNKPTYKNNKSGFKGVIFTGYSWRACIRKNNKKIHIGCFDTKERAAKAYNKAAKKLFGDFAWLNPISHPPSF